MQGIFSIDIDSTSTSINFLKFFLHYFWKVLVFMCRIPAIIYKHKKSFLSLFCYAHFFCHRCS
jgi:hypothetical protein